MYFNNVVSNNVSPCISVAVFAMALVLKIGANLCTCTHHTHARTNTDPLSRNGLDYQCPWEIFPTIARLNIKSKPNESKGQ